ncbi:MAG: OprO/OprP family phosphate-selective porin [Rhizomicrobium sp.]
MQGKSYLMAGVAVVALVASSDAGLAKTKHHTSAPAPAAATTTPAPAASNGPTNAELADRLSALEAELAADHDRRDADHSRLSALEQNFNDTTWSFDNARPTVKSGDGRFTMAIRVRFQADFAGFMQDSAAQLAISAPQATRDLSSGAVVRRAFFGVEGKAFNDFWYEFRLNGGGSNGSAGSGVTGGEGDPLVSLARVAYTGIDHFMINVGVIEPAFMFEGTTSSGQLMFLERPEIDNIAADSFGAADSRRGIELRFQKDSALMPGDNLVLNAAFTGSKTGSNAGHGPGGDEQAQVLGRASYRFWTDGASNASFGTSVASILSPGGGASTITLQDRPEIRVDGTRLIGTGGITAQHAFMWALDGGVNIDNFFLGGEWANFSVDRKASGLLAADTPTFTGWYLEGSWVLTGEPKSYTVSATNNEVGGFGAPKVGQPFSWKGDSWGAWEVAVRYSETDLNWHDTLAATATTQAGINGGKERIVALGLNWYLNNNVKLQLNDLITNVDKFSSTTHDLAHKGSQSFNTIGVRLQFSN